MKFFYPIETLSKKNFRTCSIVTASVSNVPSTCPKELFEEFFSEKKNFQSVAEFKRFFLNFWGRFATGKTQLSSKCEFPEEQSIEFFFIFRNFDKFFSDFCQKLFAGLSKLHSMCLYESCEKVGTKTFFFLFRNLRTIISDIWREYCNRCV